jgi:hypothetical protein
MKQLFKKAANNYLIDLMFEIDAEIQEKEELKTIKGYLILFLYGYLSDELKKVKRVLYNELYGKINKLS